MPAGSEDHMRRWATFGVVELDKELAHLRRAMPSSAIIPQLERYLDARRAEAVRIYENARIEPR